MSDKRFFVLIAVGLFLAVGGTWVFLVYEKILQPTGLEKALTSGVALAGAYLFHQLGVSKGGGAIQTPPQS